MNAFKGKGNDKVVTLQQETAPCAELVSYCEEVSHCQFDIFFVDWPALGGVLQGHRQVDVMSSFVHCLMSSSLLSMQIQILPLGLTIGTIRATHSVGSITSWMIFPPSLLFSSSSNLHSNGMGILLDVITEYGLTSFSWFFTGVHFTLPKLTALSWLAALHIHYLYSAGCLCHYWWLRFWVECSLLGQFQTVPWLAFLPLDCVDWPWLVLVLACV